MTADNTSTRYRRTPAPRRSTIALLRQFARSYTCASETMPPSLAGFVAN